jgi:hypothetical protein
LFVASSLPSANLAFASIHAYADTLSLGPSLTNSEEEKEGIAHEERGRLGEGEMRDGAAMGKSFFREKRLGERRWGGGLERIRLALEPMVGTRRPLNCSRVHRFDHARPPKTEKKIRGRKRNQGIVVQTASIEIESNESGNSRHCRYVTFGHLQ